MKIIWGLGPFWMKKCFSCKLAHWDQTEKWLHVSVWLLFRSVYSMECAVYDGIYVSPHHCTVTLSGNCMNFKRKNVSALKAEGINFAYIFPFLLLVFSWENPNKNQPSPQEKIACGQTHPQWYQKEKYWLIAEIRFLLSSALSISGGLLKPSHYSSHIHTCQFARTCRGKKLLTAFEQWCTLNHHTFLGSRMAAEPVLAASSTAQLQPQIGTDLSIALRMKINLQRWCYAALLV